MKIKGEVIGRPEPCTVLIERPGKHFVFTVQAVLSLDEFDNLYPEPQPRIVMAPGKPPEKVFGKEYDEALEKYFTARANWIILKAFSATEGLEWDTVDMNKPDTYGNFQKELQDSGLTRGEIQYLVSKVTEANGMDEKKMQQALERFQASQGAATPDK